ncbi:MAG: DUF5719 family protein [Actinomycetota bacterium]
MTRLLSSKLVLLGLVIVALAALYGVAGISHPVALATGSPSSALSQAPVTSAIRACASPGGPGGGDVALIAAGQAGGTAIASPDPGGAASATSAAGSGSASLSRLSAAGSPDPGPALFTLSRPGVLTRTAIKEASAKSGLQPSGLRTTGGTLPAAPSRGGVVVQATGSMAAALAVEQTSPTGITTAACPGPGTDFWFVGPGQSIAADLHLYLMNTDIQPADADVDIYTDSGPSLVSRDTGISVPPHGLLVQSLAKLLHGSRVVALHVRTSTGRVAAMLRVSKTAGDPGAWIPASLAPSRNMVIPGLPAAAGTRELYIVVPGLGSAHVKLTAVTAKGSYQPTGGSGINLPGGSAIAVPLPSLSKVNASIRIKSSVPVTASIAVTGGAAGAPGVFTVATPPILEQAVAADNISESTEGTVVLSAPQGTARVRITDAPSGKHATAARPSKIVVIAAKHTVVFRLHRPARTPAQSPYAVVVTPLSGSGPVYAGRVLIISGTVQSILPLGPALTAVPLPAARESISAAQP